MNREQIRDCFLQSPPEMDFTKSKEDFLELVVPYLQYIGVKRFALEHTLDSVDDTQNMLNNPPPIQTKEDAAMLARTIKRAQPILDSQYERYHKEVRLLKGLYSDIKKRAKKVYKINLNPIMNRSTTGLTKEKVGSVMDELKDALQNGIQEFIDGGKI